MLANLRSRNLTDINAQGDIFNAGARAKGQALDFGLQNRGDILSYFTGIENMRTGLLSDMQITGPSTADGQNVGQGFGYGSVKPWEPEEPGSFGSGTPSTLATMAGLPLMLTNYPAPGAGFALGAGLTAGGTSGIFG